MIKEYLNFVSHLQERKFQEIKDNCNFVSLLPRTSTYFSSCQKKIHKFEKNFPIPLWEEKNSNQNTIPQ